MFINKLISIGKVMFANTPFHKHIKLVYLWMNLSIDRLSCLIFYPGTKYVSYSKKQIKEFSKKGFHSQYGQDYFLSECIFKKNDGYFVEIGCNAPFFLNNSAYLESVGWSGLAFDPISRFESDWKAKRKATFHRIAISEKDGVEEFVEFLPKNDSGWEHTLSGFASFVRPEHKKIHNHKSYPIETRRLDHFVKKGQEIDLLMIDVEGAEEAVLKGVDLNQIKPRYIMIENARIGKIGSIRKVLTNSNYKLIARICATDDLFQLNTI